MGIRTLSLDQGSLPFAFASACGPSSLPIGLGLSAPSAHEEHSYRLSMTTATLSDLRSRTIQQSLYDGFPLPMVQNLCLQYTNGSRSSCCPAEASSRSTAHTLATKSSLLSDRSPTTASSAGPSSSSPLTLRLWSAAATPRSSLKASLQASALMLPRRAGTLSRVCEDG